MPKILLRGEFIGDFKGILFDKDGTLTYSEYYLFRLANLRIEKIINIIQNIKISIKIIDLIKLLNDSYGLNKNGVNPNGSLAIASRKDNLICTANILIIAGINQWSKALDIAKRAFLEADKNLELIKFDIPLINGVLKTIENLHKSGFKIAIISNDGEKGVKNFIQKNHLQDKISAYLSGDDIPQKPDPNAVLKLCKMINLKPSECILIGDSNFDLKMASDAKIGFSIGFLSGWSVKPELTYQNDLLVNWDDILTI